MYEAANKGESAVITTFMINGKTVSVRRTACQSNFCVSHEGDGGQPVRAPVWEELDVEVVEKLRMN